MMTHFTIPEMESLKWFATDLDGTIAEKSWSPNTDDFKVGTPIAANLDKLRKVHVAGYKIVVYTARPWSHYELIESWWHTYIPDIPLRALICGKLLFHMFVDDRAINANQESWLS